MSDLKQSSVALLEKAIDEKIKRARKGGTTTLATVTRIDNDGTTWVHVYGGADETPVRRMTSSAQVGDVINVMFSGLSCMGVGNVSQPAASTQQVQKVASDAADQIAGVQKGLLQVRTLIAERVATKQLDAEIANILTAAIENATINALNAKYADINATNIDTAAIQEAWVDKLLVQTNLLANDGTVFTLDAIQVDASKVTTGTLDVRRLIITRTVDGVDQKYLVEIDPNTSQPSYVKMDGDVLGPHTVSAEKLVAHSITAEELTIQNIVGTGGWINLASGTFSYGNQATGDGISWDGTNLDIKGSVRIGGTRKSLNDVATDSANAVKTANDLPVVKLSATNGTVFKRNTSTTTTLVATIYTPAGNIENATTLHNRFGNGAYLEWSWRDVITDADHIIVSTDQRIGNGGFTFTVSPDDIESQAVITCTLNY